MSDWLLRDLWEGDGAGIGILELGVVVKIRPG
jgi:hypothetical protein